MNILFGVQLHGQGHLNRSAELIRRLRARGHRVRVLTSGQSPPAYARAELGDHQHVPASIFALSDGRLDVLRTAGRMARAFPPGMRAVRTLARSLARDRIDLVLSDFEPVTAWAAGLAGVPAAGVAAQYRMTHTDAPPAAPRRMRALPELVTRSCALGLTRIFAVSFSRHRPTHARARVVGPIVDRRVRALEPRREGFFLAYLYSYTPQRVLRALPDTVPFRVYGLDREERHGRVRFLRTERDGFLRDLARCDGVVLNGSFQAVCEAAVLGKPVLSIPFASHYEERFCAAEVERAGFGVRADKLDAGTVQRFVERPPSTSRAPPDGGEHVLRELGL